jgi:hypothetical protein
LPMRALGGDGVGESFGSGCFDDHRSVSGGIGSTGCCSED